jgi:hypothetical protein
LQSLHHGVRVTPTAPAATQAGGQRL